MPIEMALREALADPLLARPAAGGLVRLRLADAKGDLKDFDPGPLLAWLLGTPPEGLGLTPQAALAALLAAGTDDDVWDAYHERVVRVARALVVARPDDLFAPLLEHLEEALTTTAPGDWPPRRIALAVTAAVAEALPAHFQRRADPHRLERLLVQAARDAESFNTRRFALTALSHLRQVTLAVADALLAALRDAGPVQQDALAAAERFRLATGDIIPALAAALQDESAATAYAAAQVLATLGRSAQAAECQPAIVEALATALRAPNARRGVYVLDEKRNIRYLGRLDEVLYRTLVQVIGAVDTPAVSVVASAWNRGSNEMVLFLAPGVEIVLVRIPAGEFLMGEEKRKVYLKEYWIGKHLVTNLQYQVFVQSTGYKPPSDWKQGVIPRGKELHPVVNVSWEDAVAFCEWLSRQSSIHVRLPTEAEWQKAARGTDGRKYPWGNSPISIKRSGTSPVGSYSPQTDSPYGCTDMVGHVWQWTLDSGERPGHHIICGGGYFPWYGMTGSCTDRYSWGPDGYKDLGFRVVVKLSE